MSVTILTGDCREVLATLPAGEFHTCVTSPPYFGLRDYGHDGQIGLEPTPDEFVAALVAVFREVRRVLRDDGTCWLNLGDSFFSSTKGSGGSNPETSPKHAIKGQDNFQKFAPIKIGAGSTGCKPKDLIGIPWMVAFALRADGWVLRQEIIWAKKNPMPESVQDRCTKAHEQIFMLSKAKWSGDYPPRTMAQGDARFLACLLECEGNIAVRRYLHRRKVPQHALQIGVANTDITILQEAQRIARCGSILERDGKNRPVHYLQWTTKEAAAILWEIYPFLFGKKRQAAIGLMLEARRANGNKGARSDIFRKDGRHYWLTDAELELRDKMWRACKALNQHEPVDLSWLVDPREGRWSPQPYYFDAKAIAESGSGQTQGGLRHKYTEGGEDRFNRTKMGLMDLVGRQWDTRNKRSVWTVASQPYSGAHFATFPPNLIEPCILAGCPVGGHVLDPFGGAGTTGLVADRLQRNATLIELNPAYAAMARNRVDSDAPLFAGAAE